MSTMVELKIGDVVRLVSGGPSMAVVRGPFGVLNETIKQVEVCWMTPEMVLVRGQFPVDALRKAGGGQ